jgi:uncharacterized membrane protein YdjX (TVP38/TMEM64 family)
VADVNVDANRDSRPLVKLLLLGLVLGAGFVAVRITPLGDLLTREGVTGNLQQLRGSVWGPVVFISLYAGATALAIPGTILTLAGGAIFGVFWGTVFNTVAANIGANLAFGVARLLGREGVERLAGSRLDKLDRATREHGFKGLLTLRLIPLVPFNALNFGSGLTAISWTAYATATLIGIFPGTVIYTNFADALLQGSQEASREALLRVVISGALLVLLSLLPTILRRLRVRVPGGAALVLAALTLPAAARAQETSGSIPDHELLTEVLAAHVEMPLVDYRGLQADAAALELYLAGLAATDPQTLAAAPPDVRLAFWINAYNACMLKQVVDHYPIRKAGGLVNAVKNTVTGRPANSVWQIDDVFTRQFCNVAGQARSQDEIEHEIIRPMGDPRIHFAVNCAARSCPPLLDEAYVPGRLDEQLDAAVLRLTEDEEHLSLERGGNPGIRLNKVLEWYKEDFGGDEGLKRFLAPYLPAADRGFVEDPSTDVRYFDYDWTLNDVAR